MNLIQPVRFLFSICFSLILFLIFLFILSAHLYAIAQVEPAKPENQAYWIKRGNPFIEYPLCYQLWQCNSQLVRPHKNTKTPLLPSGTWGLCENYLSPQTGKTIQCQRCDALAPELACF